MTSTWVKAPIQTREDRRPLFERLMADSYRQAYNMAYRLAGNAQDAEDLLQETYVRAFRFFHRYDPALPFTSWLYRIMTNLQIDSARKRGRLRTVSLDPPPGDAARPWEVPDPEARADRELMGSTLAEPLEVGLASMTPEFRTAVVLADIEGLSYEEVAEVMETSVGTVRSRIHRGRKQLRAFMERAGVCR